jgi:hypothetical protein
VQLVRQLLRACSVSLIVSVGCGRIGALTKTGVELAVLV